MSVKEQMKHKEGKKKGDIDLYALSTCVWCKKTKQLLDRMGVEYDFVEVDLLQGDEKNKATDEVKKLRAADLAPVEVDATKAFSKDVGVKTILGVQILFGYNVRPDMSEAVVYKMVKAFYDKKDELVKLDAGFTPMAKDFIGMQVQGINANPQIPVHPGLAKFLKEHKAWNDKWKVGGSSS